MGLGNNASEIVSTSGNLGLYTYTPGAYVALGIKPTEGNATERLRVAANGISILVDNDDINLSRASLTIENPSGHQSMQYFSFGGVEKASIRADTTGNIVFNASSSTYYVWRDFGNPDAITIVPHNGGRTLTIDGNLTIGVNLAANGITVAGAIAAGGDITTGIGFRFPDGSVQTTATLQGPSGPPGSPGRNGSDGRNGDRGPQGPAGVRTTTSALCGSIAGCNFVCGSGLVAGARATTASGCNATSDTGPCQSTVPGTYCCVCHA